MLGVSLDRFSAPMVLERPRYQLREEVCEVLCDMCGGPAHYRIRGLKDVYCRPCARELAVEMNLDPNEEVELIP